MKMLALPRSSTALKHCLSISKLPCLRAAQILLALQHESQLKLYHSTSQPKMPRSSLPRLDYTVDGNVARSNWMITKLSREGRIVEARQLFDEMPDADVITWTAVISAYVKCGMMREARNLFDRVDAKKNVITWTAMVSGCLRMNRFLEAERLFNEMPERNVVSWNTMIDGYVKCGRIDEALGLFEKMPEKNVVSWNTVIAGLAQCGRIEEARTLFDMMPERDVISWTAMVGGLSKDGRVDEAQVLFDRMPERNVVSWNAMITGYAQNLRLDEAFDLFERMPEKDVPSWNTMITGFIKNGNTVMARKLFDEMPRKNVISWSTMISGYVHNGQSEEALKIFLKMKAIDEVKPNEGTYLSVLGACSELAGLAEGKQIHQVINKTVYQDRVFLVSALINMYSKCGELATARKMFDDGLTLKGDLVAWNGMIAAYAHHGCGRDAINLFLEMKNLKFKPNDVTYVGLLSACSHAGLVEEGLKYFDELVRDKSIQIREDHYTCLVDLCGRAGRLKAAFNLIEQIPTEPSASVWGALLAGCNVHGDSVIGKLAAEKLSKVEMKNAGTYMLLSNIYASSGKWKEAANLRLKMKDSGLKKQPGCSWIEVGNVVHVFMVGDKSHCESKLIHTLLQNLHMKMKKIGAVLADDFTIEEDMLVL